MKNIKEVFDRFVSQDKTRQNICTPWIHEDSVAASNGHILIYVPKTRIDFEILSDASICGENDKTSRAKMNFAGLQEASALGSII